MPSLRALQAAGLMEDEEDQFMTKARGQEERAKSKERRELRKAGEALKVRPGEVLETLTREDLGVGGGDNDTTGSERRGAWRPMRRAEILKQVKVDAKSKRIQTQHGMNNETTERRSASSARSCRRSTHDPEDTAGSVKKSSGKRQAGEADQADGAASESVVAESSKRQRTERLDNSETQAVSTQHRTHKSHTTRSMSRKQLENCRKRPRVGEDGVARCW